MNKTTRFFTRFLAVLLSVQGAIAAQALVIPHAQAAAQTVVINELMWMGSTASTADEWIELYNTSSSPIDLAGYQLTHAGTSDTTLTIPSGTVAANGYFVVSNYDETSASSILNLTPNWVTTSVSLSNTCTPIDLLMPDTTPIDTMNCSGSSYFAGSSVTHSSIERVIGAPDGTLSTSWQTSVGRSHLDPDHVYPHTNYATPGYANDVTSPADGTVTSQPANYFDVAHSGLKAQWSGFSEDTSTIANYRVGLGSTATNANVVPFVSVAGDQSEATIDLSSAVLVEGQQYYVLVRARNAVGLKSNVVASAPVIFRATTPPDAFTLIDAHDVSNDNGGSVQVGWNASSSDVTNYQVQYQLAGGTWATPTTVDAGSATSATVSGLTNATDYDFRVVATSFNATTTTSSDVKTTQALDNLAPVLDITKVVLSQNAPGTADTISGQAGSSSEAATINVFDRDPADPSVVMIGSVSTDATLGFPAIGLGDNQFGKVYLQLVDAAGNASVAQAFNNDIVAPNASTLSSLKSDCKTDNCRVELQWQDNGPDTDHYQIGYTVDGVSKRTLATTATTLLLDLPSSKTYDFVVYAFDLHGNQSVISNAFHLVGTPGVVTTITLQNGQPVTVTTATVGAKEVVAANTNTVKPSVIALAQAAQPTTTSETPQVANEQTNTASQNNSQDWLRIFVVVILLLIVAGGFYALSRSFNDSEDVLELTKPKARGRATATKATEAAPKRRGRPAGSGKKRGRKRRS